MDEQSYSALPVTQRKQLQQQLKDQGLYGGGIDGRWGEGTKNAFKQQDQQRAAKEQADRESALENKKLDIHATEVTANATKSKAEADALAAKTKRQEDYNKAADSGWGIATKIGANVGAPIAGTAAGMGLGKTTNFMLDQAQRSRNDVLRGVAADRLAGRTTVEGARAAARASGAYPMSNPALRTTARMLPHMGLGALSIGKGIEVLNGENPDEGFYPTMANRAAGLGYIGAGAGLAKQGLRYGAAPGVAPDAQALAIINSNQIRRNGIPGAPGAAAPEVADKGALTAVEPEAAPKALPAPDKTAASAASAEKRTHANRLIAAAKQADASGPLTKQKAVDHLLAEGNITPDNRMAVAAELGIKPGPRFSERITAAVKNMAKSRGASALLGPIIAGGTAYMATPGKAQAATGEAGANRDEALTNAGIAAGIAGGAQRYLPKALKFIGERTGPMMLSDMATDLGNYLQDKGIMRSPGQRIADMSGASAVPSPNPLRTTPEPGNQYYPLSGDMAINDAMDVVQRANGGRVTGGLHFEGGGRTDNIPLDVVPGTYIVPADIVSALGQGNTLAGIKVLDNMFPPQSDFSGGSKGKSSQDGKTNGKVPIIAAGGEYQVDPYHVAALGGGNVTKGADILDAFIKDVRRQHIETLSSLPSPAQ
ncbi:MAG TPA: hypothetical protein VI358_17990 [Pseudolabrys sp.]